MPAHKISPVWRLWEPEHHPRQRTRQVQVLPFQTIRLKYRQVLGFGGKLSCGLLTPMVVHVKYRKCGLLLTMGYLVETHRYFIPLWWSTSMALLQWESAFSFVVWLIGFFGFCSFVWGFCFVFDCASMELAFVLVLSSFLCFYIIFLHRNNYPNVMWEPRVKVMLTFRYTVLLSEMYKLVVKKNTQRRDLSGKISSEKFVQSLKLRKNRFRLEICK